MIVEHTRKGFYHFSFAGFCHSDDLRIKTFLDERTFLYGPRHTTLLFSSLYDKSTRLLILLPRLISLRRHTGRGNWMLTALRSTTKRMVNRVHRLTSHFRSFSKPAGPSSLTKGNVHKKIVANQTDRRIAFLKNHSHFARRELESYVFTLFCSYNGTAGRPYAPTDRLCL